MFEASGNVIERTDKRVEAYEITVQDLEFRVWGQVDFKSLEFQENCGKGGAMRRGSCCVSG